MYQKAQMKFRENVCQSSQMAHIIFKAPKTVDDLENSQITERPQRFQLGSYNKRLVQYVLEYNGFELTNEPYYHLSWRSSPETDRLKYSNVWINHFPNSKSVIGNKACLARLIQNHPRISEFHQFLPTSYVLPGDRDKIQLVMKSRPSEKFIVKPPNRSCGQGIHLASFNEFYKIPSESVVSVYISRPLLIDSFKFDLRIYVLVTSFQPLSAFVYKDGLARFATERYANHNASLYCHLTNATLNKKRSNWSPDFKWTLVELLDEVQHRYQKRYDELFNSILMVVAQTLAVVQPSMISAEKCFELYGFDIIFDENFKPWLLEINTFPMLGYDEAADFKVKVPMIANMLTILGIPEDDNDECVGNRVELEDERNRDGGGGFVRIFPSQKTKHLNDFLVAREHHHDKWTLHQYVQLFVLFFKVLYQKVKEQTLPAKEVERIHRFLLIQGYRIKNSTETILNAISILISRIELKTSQSEMMSKLPHHIVEKFSSFDRKEIHAYLSECPYTIVKNIHSVL